MKTREFAERPIVAVSEPPRWHRALRAARDAMLHPTLGLVLLLVLVGAVRVARAAFVETLWLDELHTITLSQRSVAEIFALLAGDTAPPLYTLLFKWWTESLAALGIGPGVLSGRMLGVICWAAGTVAAWFIARRLVGANLGSAMIWIVAGAAQWGEAARNMRNYALAIPLILCALLLLGVLSTRTERRPDAAAEIACWILYGILVGAAMLTHNLCGLLALILGVAWLVGVVRGGTLRTSYVWGGLLGNVVALLCYAPWAGYLLQQANFQSTMVADWQTPRTPASFALTFVYWLPGGELPSLNFRPTHTPFGVGAYLMLAVGIATVLVPMLAFIWPRMIRRKSAAAADANVLAGVHWLATTGLLGGLAWVVGLYNLEPIGFGNTWHAPRYPSLGVGLWLCGLIALCAWTGARWRSRTVAMLCAAPLAAAAVGGCIMQFVSDLRLTHVRPARQAHARKVLRAAGLGERPVVYVTGTGLLPYFPSLARRFDLRPAHDLMALPPSTTTTLAIMRLNPWAVNDTPGDKNLITFLQRHEFSPRTDQIRVSDALLYLIPDADSTIVALCARAAYQYQPPPIPANAVSVARQETQRAADGWGASNPDPTSPKHRWAQKPGGVIRFDGKLDAGNYTLHLHGQRNQWPVPEVPARLRVGDAATTTVRLGVGAFHLRVPVSLREAVPRPTVTLTCPPWTKGRHLQDGDDTQVMYEFSHAYFLRAD